MSRKAGFFMSLVWGMLFCVIAAAGGVGAAYLEDIGLFKGKTKGVELSDTYSFSGPVQLGHLGLSRQEIVALNNKAWKYRERLAETEIKISSENWTKKGDPDCELEYTFQARAQDGHVVESAMRRTTRKELIRQLERQLDVADGVLRKCHDKFPNFKIVYM